MSSDKRKAAAALPSKALAVNASSDPKLDRLAQSRIGDQLRSMYDELLVQPVPDRFKDLLLRLDAHAERKAK